ncbi:hypothetical protein BJV77DRAFT_978103 [Russula vinacea]|nr:hypothetical protein BJV77DRAFT_978103 [Russula vinacea]
MAFTSSQLFAASLVSFTVYVLLRRKRRHPFPFPPGPKSFPLIGNLRDLPFEYEWSHTKRSDIVHAECLGIHVLPDLLEKRSSIYSDSSHPDLSTNTYQTQLTVMTEL